MKPEEERKLAAIARQILRKAMVLSTPEGKMTFERLASVVDDVDTLVVLAKYVED
jgi:hypothetical protein